MNVTIIPGKLQGTVQAIPSKSFAHRLLILAAFGEKPVQLQCADTNRDIEATAACLRALGAEIHRTDTGYLVSPADCIPNTAVLFCGESGSTLRFMLPVVGALGVDGRFITEGRLSQRPLSPLWEEMERMGCSLFWEDSNTLCCSGKLQSGHYRINGSVSSQFITGLMLGLSLLPDKSELEITGKLESAPYVAITADAMASFGLSGKTLGGKTLATPSEITVEGDWSNAAFFLTASALGSPVAVSGLNAASIQGDRAVEQILPLLDTGCPSISARDIPDLVPILAVAAAGKHGAVFTDIQRLRLKESDRVLSVCDMLSALGIHTENDENSLRVFPGVFTGGTVDAVNDHRIAMAAAIAATTASGPVTILGAECVSKSYPHFWDDYRELGGNYEFDLR